MSVQLISTIEELRLRVAAARRSEKTVGLVPTMGALHAGHIRLIDRAVQDCDLVIVTLFVNPTQFNQPDDFAQYPRTIEHDLAVCEEHSADVLFAPSVEEMYPGRERTFVEVTHLTDHLCGPYRPGHFRGVATVVAKLLNIAQAGRAYFGEKDAQQLAVIKRTVKDLNIPTEIVSVPTLREPDGLALSSRNQHLNAEDRKTAVALYQALTATKEAVAGGEESAEEVLRIARKEFEKYPGARVEYFELVDPDDMQPVETIQGPVRAATAVWVGETRLIDNMLCVPGERDRGWTEKRKQRVGGPRFRDDGFE